MKAQAISIGLMLTACSGESAREPMAAGSWTPSERLISEIERQLLDQPGLGDIRLERYGRYYVGKTDQSAGRVRRYVVGGALEPVAGGKLGIHIGTPMPPVKMEDDAGCTAVFLKFDVDAESFTRAECAGG